MFKFSLVPIFLYIASTSPVKLSKIFKEYFKAQYVGTNSIPRDELKTWSAFSRWYIFPVSIVTIHGQKSLSIVPSTRMAVLI